MRQQIINNTRVFTIRIPEEWYEKIVDIAREECRTKNSVAKQAIKEFLEHKELQMVGSP